MIAEITTIYGEEYTGLVSGFVNLAHGKIHEPLAHRNFGICLTMRVAPITFDIIKNLHIHYVANFGINKNIVLRYNDVYEMELLDSRNLFFMLKSTFINNP